MLQQVSTRDKVALLLLDKRAWGRDPWHGKVTAGATACWRMAMGPLCMQCLAVLDTVRGWGQLTKMPPPALWPAFVLAAWMAAVWQAPPAATIQALLCGWGPYVCYQFCLFLNFFNFYLLHMKSKPYTWRVFVIVSVFSAFRHTPYSNKTSYVKSQQNPYLKYSIKIHLLCFLRIFSVLGRKLHLICWFWSVFHSLQHCAVQLFI